jgi:hypothetical protein
LGRSKFNWWTYRIAIVALLTIGALWTLNGQSVVSYEAVTSISDTAFDLTVQILGFLIGGFAIFATISDSKLMVRLAKTPMKKTDLSVFKTIFFNFISVFYIYVVTLSLAILTKIGASLHIVSLEGLSDEMQVHLVTLVNSIVFLVLGAAVVLSVLRLKSFIWNIYQAYLTLLVVGQIVDDGSNNGSGS